MSGITADNVERSSGLIKAASVGPSTSSSDPTVSTNPSSVGTRIVNTTSGEVFVCTDITAGENVWKGQVGTTVEPPKYFGARATYLPNFSDFGGYRPKMVKKRDNSTF